MRSLVHCNSFLPLITLGVSVGQFEFEFEFELKYTLLQYHELLIYGNTHLSIPIVGVFCTIKLQY